MAEQSHISPPVSGPVPGSTSLASRAGFAAALQRPVFTLLWLSEAISLVGDRILLVVLINLVYEQTQSASAVGLLALIKSLPALLLGALAGVLVDRWPRKWVMVVANLLQGALVLVIPGVRSLPPAQELGVIFIVYLVMSLVSQFFIPARAACIPSLVPCAALSAANALFAMAFVGAIALGPALGGWIGERFGLPAAFYTDAVTFLGPALVVSFLAIPELGQAPTCRSLGADWREGLALVRRRADLRQALLLLGAAVLQIAVLSVLGVLVVREKLGGSAGDFGLMMSLTGVGMLLAALANSRLGQRFNRLALGAAGALLAGLGMLGLSLAASLPLAYLSGALLGLGFITVQVSVQTSLQMTEAQVRGRMFGLGQAVMGSVTFLAAALAGLLAARLGAAAVLVATALVPLAAGIYVLIFGRLNRCAWN